MELFRTFLGSAFCCGTDSWYLKLDWCRWIDEIEWCLFDSYYSSHSFGSDYSFSACRAFPWDLDLDLCEHQRTRLLGVIYRKKVVSLLGLVFIIRRLCYGGGKTNDTFLKRLSVVSCMVDSKIAFFLPQSSFSQHGKDPTVPLGFVGKRCLPWSHGDRGTDVFVLVRLSINGLAVSQSVSQSVSWKACQLGTQALIRLVISN